MSGARHGSPMARLPILVALVSIVVGGSHLPASANLRERAARTWMTNGKVFALVRAGDMLILGGRFSKLLPPSGSDASPITVSNVAALDIATGQPLAFSPPVTGDGAQVRALAVADGRLYIGGSFARLGGTAAGNIGAVRLSDATRIGSFAPHVRGRVLSLLATSDRLYAGGAFGRVDGVPRAKLAAWEMPNGALSNVWHPQTASGSVHDLAFDGSRASIIVAGAFSAMTEAGRDLPRRTLAKVDAIDGRVRAWRPDGIIGDPQTAWSVHVTKRAVHGGFGRGPNYAASFQVSGRVGERRWRFATTGNVQTVELSPDGSRLFIGGHFGLNGRPTMACGTSVRGLVALDPRTGAPKCSWLPRLAPFQTNYQGVWSSIVTPDGLWVGGGWRTIGGREQRNIAFFPR